MRPLIRQLQIDQAVKCLKNGGLVAMPTETVYGLAADASNEEAVRKIFATKGRPVDHPLIVHIAHLDQLAHWAHDIPEFALILAKQFWPGPMTLILKKQPHVLDAVTGGQDTVGIRIPNHPVAQQLLQTFGGGVAAPSANRFGYISPTTAQHVREDLGDKVDVILDGGNCGIGIESTIIDCTGDFPRILRPGMITIEMIETRLGLSPRWGDTIEKTPRVSGALDSHYAPRTKTHLFSAEKINDLIENSNTKNIVILSMRKPHSHRIKMYDSRIPHRMPSPNADLIHWILMPSDQHGYAHRLYEQLHFADQLRCDEIWIEEAPNTTEWNGIIDRIKKASS